MGRDERRRRERAPADFRFESAVDVLAILAVLCRHEVDFVVIGGVAVARHGFVRATKDLDIVPAPGRGNIEKLHAALLEIGAEPLAVGDFARRELPVQLDLDGLLLGGNWDLQTRFGRLDVMQYIEGALESPADYGRMLNEAVVSRFEFGDVHFVGYEQLIDLKHLAGRDTDLIDIRALHEARR